MKTIALTAILLVMSTTAMAAEESQAPIEGYKSAKFGMTQQQLAKTKLCTFDARKPKSERFERLCSDLKFSGETTDAIFVFVGGELDEINVLFNPDDLEGVFNGLKKKYGEPLQRHEILEDFKKMQFGPVGTEAYVQFPNKQVYLKFKKITQELISSAIVYVKRTESKEVKDSDI